MADRGLWSDYAIESFVRQLFPSGVAVRVATQAMRRLPLLAEEAFLAADATPKRREEITSGRNAARAALVALGAPPAPILRGQNREPLWPSGFVGSITHCNDFACAVVAPAVVARSLGVDAEEATPLEEALTPLVCRENELQHFTHLPPAPGANWPKLAFCAKEAFYKCLSPLTNEMIDFTDVSVRFSVEADGLQGACQLLAIAGEPKCRPSMLGRWGMRGSRVYTAAYTAKP